jgi:hypothetical protein
MGGAPTRFLRIHIRRSGDAAPSRDRRRISVEEEQIMSFVKIARPIGLVALLALGVAASGAAEARTGFNSQHGPSALQSADPHGPAYPSQTSGR